MRTRAEQGTVASAKRRGRAAGAQLPATLSITDGNESLLPPDPVATMPHRQGGLLRSRAGRGLLMVEGLTIGVLGGVALAWSMGFTRFSPDGIPMLGLKVTPSHAGLLLIVGTLALLACLGQRSALIFCAFTAFGWAALTVLCMLRVAHHAPGVLGFDPRDGLLYGALCAYNLVTATCLALALFYQRS
jgi:hypothetical protein